MKCSQQNGECIEIFISVFRVVPFFRIWSSVSLRFCDIAAYQTAAPLTEPGDLVILDYMMIHRSGFNTSARPRWSMQVRYFNFSEPSGVAHGWKGGTTAGVPINDVHPGLLIEKDSVQ